MDKLLLRKKMLFARRVRSSSGSVCSDLRQLLADWRRADRSKGESYD